MMKHIRLLVLKDFQVHLKSIINYVAIGFIFMLVFTMSGSLQMSFPISVFIIIYGFINKCLYEDEKNNTLRLLVSLPVKRDSIVIARYLSTVVIIVVIGAVMGLISTFLTGALSAADAHAGAEVPGAMVNVLMVVCMGLLFLLLMSIYLPMAYKLGYIKAVNINRFVFLGIFALFGALPAIFRMKGDKPQGSFSWMGRVESFIESIGPAWMVVLLVLFSAGIYLLSMYISIKLFRKRQLF
ncbi:MAG: ABC-2 transporter permease [Bacillota bacterium]